MRVSMPVFVRVCVEIHSCVHLHASHRRYRCSVEYLSRRGGEHEDVFDACHDGRDVFVTGGCRSHPCGGNGLDARTYPIDIQRLSVRLRVAWMRRVLVAQCVSS